MGSHNPQKFSIVSTYRGAEEYRSHPVGSRHEIENGLPSPFDAAPMRLLDVPSSLSSAGCPPMSSFPRWQKNVIFGKTLRLENLLEQSWSPEREEKVWEKTPTIPFESYTKGRVFFAKRDRPVECGFMAAEKESMSYRLAHDPIRGKHRQSRGRWTRARRPATSTRHIRACLWIVRVNILARGHSTHETY